MQVPMEILHSLYLFLLMVSLIVPILAYDPLSYALLSLKSELVDDSNTLQDWFLPSHEVKPSSQIDACSWTGIKCSENASKIISLDLSMKNLGGSLSGKQFNLLVDVLDLNLSYNSFSNHLPPGIFNLTSLRSLDISRNNFSGSFPSGISNLQNLVVLDAFSNSFSGPLPADASQIKSLEVLNFAGSYFSGQIPSQYGDFKSIEFIHLAGNFLSGIIPSELGNLKTLSHMEIGYNSYEGGIPMEFGNMSDLIYLDIADANISGSIPSQLSNLTKLESLFLFKNQLNGKIPLELSRILALKSLDLSDNLLSGSIPDSFSELKKLKLLSLMYNDLYGPIPQGIAKLPQLDTLLIWSNYFTGSLPEDLGRFSKLKHMDVSTNYFVGPIPNGICAGGELEKLILFSNNFTGGLSPSLSNCSSLVRIRLEDNLFSGDISLPFGNMKHISYIDLSINQFTGGIPSDVIQAYELQYLNLSNNQQLGGVIPVRTWSLPNLQNLSLVSCGLSGNIPPFAHCKSVSVIEMRSNNLSGGIPESVWNCKHLMSIDLAENSLTGPVPDKFGTSLKIFNVSYNDISGSIPSNEVFKTMDKSAFLGNPKLCGEPLRRCHRGISNGLELGSRRAQKVAWILILCAVIVFLIVAAVFGILYLKRGKKGHWKMIAFSGLPQFTAKDVLRSFNCAESMENFLPDSIGKVVLPTGITISAKKMLWDKSEIKVKLEMLNRIGNARHKNLTRLLGVCYNNHVAYLLYDYLPNGNLSEKIRISRDWESKCRIVSGIARALCFLHHECYPPIAHGNLKSSNVLFDENMEAHLAEYGLGPVPLPSKIRDEREELKMDIYNFGELILEILTNGRTTNASGITQKDDLIKEVADENGDIVSSASFLDEVRSVIEVALLCTTSRPSMHDVLKLLEQKHQ